MDLYLARLVCLFYIFKLNVSAHSFPFLIMFYNCRQRSRAGTPASDGFAAEYKVFIFYNARNRQAELRSASARRRHCNFDYSI